jgi:hypothetical protein
LLDVKRDTEGENKAVTVEGKEIEWTKDGMEETLAAVGIACGYNFEVSVCWSSSADAVC